MHQGALNCPPLTGVRQERNLIARSDLPATRLLDDESLPRSCIAPLRLHSRALDCDPVAGEGTKEDLVAIADDFAGLAICT